MDGAQRAMLRRDLDATDVVGDARDVTESKDHPQDTRDDRGLDMPKARGKLIFSARRGIEVRYHRIKAVGPDFVAVDEFNIVKYKCYGRGNE